MKKTTIITFLLTCSLFVISCEQTNTAQNNSSENAEVNTDQNVKTSETSENSAERHIKVKSENNIEDTYAALKKAIQSKEPISIIAELDHAENAKKAEMELRPTKIIMFGNPALGTPLMKANQLIGLDLPQKMLVYEDKNGDVYVAYNDPKVIAENHAVTGQDEVLGKISNALKGLADAAAKNNK